MATTSTTITINSDAYRRLKKLKRPGDSFSDVILQHVHAPAETAGELLDRFLAAPAPEIDEDRLEYYMKNRGRRSKRP